MKLDITSIHLELVSESVICVYGELLNTLCTTNIRGLTSPIPDLEPKKQQQ